MKRKKIDWIAIAEQFSDRSASVRSIARDHGICEAAIRRWAKRNHIERDRRTPGATADRKKDKEGASIASLFNIPKNEAGACAVLRILLKGDALAETWGLPKIVEWREEFAFRHGRVDFLLVHEDQSVSLVEVKNCGSDREVLCGIGQLHLYESQARKTLEAGGYHTIRKILCVAMKQKNSRHLFDACVSAGVTIEFIGTVMDHQESAIKVLCDLLGLDHEQQ